MKEGESLGPDGRFAANMRAMRAARGWNQSELARRVTNAGTDGFHQTTISRIEAGSRPVRLGEATAIARVLGTTVELMVSSDGRDAIVTTLTESANTAMNLWGTAQMYVDEFWQAILRLRLALGDPNPFDHSADHAPFEPVDDAFGEYVYVGWGDDVAVDPELESALRSLNPERMGEIARVANLNITMMAGN